jgi:hypothetical protein
MADAGCHAVYDVGLRLFACWDCGFESRRRHGCLCLVNFVCFAGRGIYDVLIARPGEFSQVCMCHWVWSGATITVYTYNEWVEDVRLLQKRPMERIWTTLIKLKHFTSCFLAQIYRKSRQRFIWCTIIIRLFKYLAYICRSLQTGSYITWEENKSSTERHSVSMLLLPCLYHRNTVCNKQEDYKRFIKAWFKLTVPRPLTQESRVWQSESSPTLRHFSPPPPHPNGCMFSTAQSETKSFEPINRKLVSVFPHLHSNAPLAQVHCTSQKPAPIRLWRKICLDYVKIRKPIP